MYVCVYSIDVDNNAIRNTTTQPWPIITTAITLAINIYIYIYIHTYIHTYCYHELFLAGSKNTLFGYLFAHSLLFGYGQMGPTLMGYGQYVPMGYGL